MRQETNNEMDLLLRRLSRRDGPVTSGADPRIDSDHLDADELSSYAENVLPAAARARYTEHLAECSRCRELVVQLSASVPAVAAKETVMAAGPSALKKFLASLFSPMVLRYAVPALGLIVVTAIGIAVYRSEQPSSSVAQLNGYMDTKPTPVPNQQPQAADPTLEKQARTEPQSSVATRETNAARTKETEPAPASNAAPAAKEVRAEPTTDARVQRPEAQPSATPAPPSAPPKPAETVDEMRVEVERRKPQAAPGSSVAPAGGLARQRTAEGFKDAEKKSEDVAADRSAAKPKTAARAQTAGETSTFHSTEQEKDRSDGMIRTVAGRRFRKQGGVWVDTAYDSGSAITNVSRNSEQYRALVADEPAIKTIADQLDGAIIVVWKGRTYRIR